MNTAMRQWAFLALVAAITLLLDQASKGWVLQDFQLGETRAPIPLLVPYFQFTYSHNSGIAFGLLPQAGDVILVLALVIVAVLIYSYPRLPQAAWGSRLAVGLVVGGALGNVIDRLQHGYVIDFIHYRIPNLISNVSNLADHAIVFGVLLIIAGSWRAEAQPTPSDETDLKEPTG